MGNQNARRGVEAGGAPSARRQLYALGEELEQLLVHDIDRVVHTETKCVPAPRQMYYDVLRKDGRTPVTVANIGAALSGLARTPAIADRVLTTIIEHFGAWLFSHREVGAGGLTDHWASETRAQADADVAQARADRARAARPAGDRGRHRREHPADRRAAALHRAPHRHPPRDRARAARVPPGGPSSASEPRMITTACTDPRVVGARNESAPAEVEGSTGAALESASGDRHPLRATYDGPASLVNTRAVTYVHVGTGQATTHLLRRNEFAPTKLGGERDVHEARILAHDEDASPTTNAEYAKLVVNCLVVTNRAKTVPLIVARALIEELQELAIANANFGIYANEQRRRYEEAERTIQMGLVPRPTRSVG